MEKLKAHNQADDQKESKPASQEAPEERILQEDQENKHIINQQVYMEAVARRNEQDQWSHTLF